MSKFTPETAAEMGRRGGQASGESRRNKQGREYLDSKEDEIAKDLYAAATGTGRFKDLAPEKQLQALLKLAEMVWGKPGQAKPRAEAQPDTGITIE